MIVADVRECEGRPPHPGQPLGDGESWRPRTGHSGPADAPARGPPPLGTGAAAPGARRQPICGYSPAARAPFATCTLNAVTPQVGH